MDDSERRQTLAAFLRNRRERLQASDLNLPIRRRRRTPGLRREEVAELADISVSWYTLLEQGRNVHPSPQVLERLVDVLRLSSREAQYLFLLAREELPARLVFETQQITPALQRVIDALSPHPAFIIGPRWDVLAWNTVADLLFSFHEPQPPHSRNIVWRFFLREQIREFDAEWEEQAKNLIARFRADYVRYPGHEAFQTLVEDLQQSSPHFRVWWAQQDVQGFPDGPRTMNLPTLGLLEFDHVTFQTSMLPDLRMKVYSATSDTAQKLARMLETLSVNP